MTARPRLSICIATFNRGAFLGETLASIVPQVSGDVELVIVDGASTDDTAERIAPFAARCAQLRYHRETTNSGIDRDFDKAVEHANGEYVWLMTDDDLLLPHAVARALAATTSDPDLVVVNSAVCDATFANTLNARLIDVQSDRRYTAAQSRELFLDCVNGLTFIGGTIIRRALWLARDRRSYYGSLFIHVGVIFQAPIAAALLVAEPLIRIRYGVAMWTPRAFEVWMYLWPRLVWSFLQFDDATKARITPREPWRRYSKLVHYRAKGGYTLAEARVRFVAEPLRFRTIATLIAALPRAAAMFVSLVYLSWRNDTNRVPIYDLVKEVKPDPLRRALSRAFTI